MLVLLIVANNHSIRALSLSANLLSGATADTRRPLYPVHLFNCTFARISHQPIPLQQLSASRHVDTVKAAC